MDQQSVLALDRVRQGFIKATTAQANKIRGVLAAFGLVVPQGIDYITSRVCGGGDAVLSSDDLHVLPASNRFPCRPVGGPPRHVDEKFWIGKARQAQAPRLAALFARPQWRSWLRAPPSRYLDSPHSMNRPMRDDAVETHGRQFVEESPPAFL
jgi:hypothetical protein